MPSARRSVPLAGLLVALAAAAAPADDASDKQKKVAEANVKKSEVGKTTVTDAEAVILVSTLPEAKAKAVADALSKVFKTARKGLQFEEKEEAWKGKLTVYHLPNPKDYTLFMRLVVGASPDAPSFLSIRSDEPFVVGKSEGGAKGDPGDVAAEMGPLVSGAVLAAKAGSATMLPGWVKTGFARAAALRAEGAGGKRLTAYKTQVRAAVTVKGKPTPIGDVWEGGPDADVLATSLMDYFAYGPGQRNLAAFLTGLKPNENGDTPAITTAIEAAGWKLPELEAAWRKWVLAGLVEGKGPEPKKTPPAK